MTRALVAAGLLLGAAACGVEAPGTEEAAPAAAPAATLPASPAADSDASLWVTLGDADQLVEMDPYAFTEIRRLTVDPEVHGLAVSADGSRVYVASDRTGNFQVVDTAAWEIVAEIPLGTDPNQMTLTLDGRYAYVPMRGEDTVAVVQLEPLELVRKIEVPEGPHDAITLADGRIWVGAQYGAAIAVLDPDTQSLVQTIATDDGVRPLEATRDGRTVYVALSNLIGFVVVEAATGTVTRRVELAQKPEGVPEPYVETYTHALQLSADETELWVTDDVHDLIRVVRLSDMREIAQIPVGHFPHWFAMRPDGQVSFVSLWYSDAVAAIDTRTRRVLANMQFSHDMGPKRIAVARRARER